MADWTQLSPSCDSRNGSRVTLLAIHTSEGATTAAGLANYLCDPVNEVSYHDICDDDNSVHIVDYELKCWALRSGNSISENFCMTGFAAWSRNMWLSHAGMLERCAQWIAKRATARNIPIRKLTSAEVNAGDSGVIGHINWTEGMHDGTHTDPGPSFPWDTVIARAREIAANNPKPNPMPGGGNVSKDIQLEYWTDDFGQRRFRGTGHVEAGTPAVGEAWVTWGTTWGETHIDLLNFLDGFGGGMVGRQDELVLNNHSDGIPVPEHTRQVTVEGTCDPSTIFVVSIYEHAPAA